MTAHTEKVWPSVRARLATPIGQADVVKRQRRHPFPPDVSPVEAPQRVRVQQFQSPEEAPRMSTRSVRLSRLSAVGVGLALSVVVACVGQPSALAAEQRHSQVARMVTATGAQTTAQARLGLSVHLTNYSQVACLELYAPGFAGNPADLKIDTRSSTHDFWGANIGAPLQFATNSRLTGTATATDLATVSVTPGATAGQVVVTARPIASRALFSANIYRLPGLLADVVLVNNGAVALTLGSGAAAGTVDLGGQSLLFSNFNPRRYVSTFAWTGATC